jgi:hypothetical protein
LVLGLIPVEFCRWEVALAQTGQMQTRIVVDVNGGKKTASENASNLLLNLF